MKELQRKNLFKELNGWRNEHYSVQAKFGQKALFSMERAAVSLFGIKGYGCHINGYVRDENGVYKMWIARRSKTKQTYPGKLDNFVSFDLNTLILRFGYLRPHPSRPQEASQLDWACLNARQKSCKKKRT